MPASNAPVRKGQPAAIGANLKRFDAASIYLQFRRPLADALLAEDGPAWLRHALGWLCYAQRRLPNVQRGAVVYISLRDRLPCDSAYLPPPELPFDAALAWALRGGEPEAPAPGPTDDADQALRVLESPEGQLWRGVLERLSRELSPAVIDSQLRPARLIALDQDQCLIVSSPLRPSSRATGSPPGWRACSSAPCAS